jgi:hypothetical protein
MGWLHLEKRPALYRCLRVKFDKPHPMNVRVAQVVDLNAAAVSK